MMRLADSDRHHFFLFSPVGHVLRQPITIILTAGRRVLRSAGGGSGAGLAMLRCRGDGDGGTLLYL